MSLVVREMWRYRRRPYGAFLFDNAQAQELVVLGSHISRNLCAFGHS